MPQETESRLTRLFIPFFVALCLWRMAYPFLQNPLLTRVGVSRRQWEQAETFFDPVFMGGVDAFFYQFWLMGLQRLSFGHDVIIQLVIGLMCAAVPVSWYLTARELLPRGAAQLTALGIALLPNTLTIYRYFTSETLLIPLLGFACWCTARAWKRRSARWVIAASLLWVLCAQTRVTLLPLMLVILPILWWQVRIRWHHAAAILLPAALIIAGSAYHNYLAVGVASPFGIPQMNAIYARSEAVRIVTHFDDKRNWFRSPSYFLQPFSPLSNWRISPRGEEYHLKIKRENGWRDWQKALNDHPVTLSNLIRQLSHNAIFLLTGSSWPDAWPDSWNSAKFSTHWESELNHGLRWLWTALIPLVVIGALFYRGSALQNAFIIITLSLLLVMLLQTSAIFEGRYRKPVEPMLMICAAMMLQPQRTTQERKVADDG